MRRGMTSGPGPICGLCGRSHQYELYKHTALADYGQAGTIAIAVGPDRNHYQSNHYQSKHGW
jgi:hypothetical protein